MLLGVVGSRRASRQGLDFARLIGRAAAALGAPVVSGLARGIDQAAHAGSLEAGPTWAVLGCGLDACYPPGAERLAERVAASGGLLSEFPPGCPPLPHHFPRRNRIIAALGAALLVVEARERSGALITAGEAVALGRELGVAPGNPLNPAAMGSNRLLADGALPVLGPDDLPLLLGLERRPALGRGELPWTAARCEAEGVGDAETLAARAGWTLLDAVEALAEWERRGEVELAGGGRFRALAEVDGEP